MGRVEVNWGKVLAYIMIVLQAAVCVGYLLVRDYRHAAYWFFATGITASVTL